MGRCAVENGGGVVEWFRALDYIFSTVILASHSPCSLSPLGVAMRSSQLPIGSFLPILDAVFSLFSLSLSLAILALYTVSASDVLVLVEYAYSRRRGRG